MKPGRDAALFAGVLALMIEQGFIDREFIERETVGFEAVAGYCREWTPARTAAETGVPERSIRRAAEWWGKARTSFLLHARGIEHHTKGVQNVLGAINLVLASGMDGMSTEDREGEVRLRRRHEAHLVTRPGQQAPITWRREAARRVEKIRHAASNARDVTEEVDTGPVVGREPRAGEEASEAPRGDCGCSPPPCPGAGPGGRNHGAAFS